MVSWLWTYDYQIQLFDTKKRKIMKGFCRYSSLNHRDGSVGDWFPRVRQLTPWHQVWSTNKILFFFFVRYYRTHPCIYSELYICLSNFLPNFFDQILKVNILQVCGNFFPVHIMTNYNVFDWTFWKKSSFSITFLQDSNSRFHLTKWSIRIS